MSWEKVGKVLFIAVVLIGACGAPSWAEYDPKGRRDPLVVLLTRDGKRINPPGYSEGNTAEIGADVVLHGILYDPIDPVAIINGEVVQEKETVGAVKVLKIEPTKVTILVNGNKQELVVERPTTEGIESIQ